MVDVDDVVASVDDPGVAACQIRQRRFIREDDAERDASNPTHAILSQVGRQVGARRGYITVRIGPFEQRRYVGTEFFRHAGIDVVGVPRFVNSKGFVTDFAGRSFQRNRPGFGTSRRIRSGPNTTIQ